VISLLMAYAFFSISFVIWTMFFPCLSLLYI